VPSSEDQGLGAGRLRIRRFLPLAVIALLMLVVFLMGWHRHLSLETLAKHHARIDAFVSDHHAAALGVFVLVYIAIVALSVPGAVFLTLSGGILFGWLFGGIAAALGATIGAAIVFLIAKTAIGHWVLRSAGTRAAKVAEGFRADAFNYLLFLRLVPVFPFWLVNLVPAIAGVRLTTFVAATAIGILPATFAFAFVGAGLDSVLRAQERAYEACLAVGRPDCRIDFDLRAAVTPELIAALVALGVVALIPVAVRRWRQRPADAG
jgi:uncharacterized membrane protein YdjX (TVP38/TMEM64 family)